jgi:hypothetical protein
MSVHAWTVASLIIAISVCTIGALCLAVGAALKPCDHTLKPEVHAGTGRIFYSCRCAKRFTL